MDAVEFIKAWNRMCRNYNGCFKCPLEGKECDRLCDIDADTIVHIVEQWAKEHPRKTRQSVFLEQYPNVRLVDGVVDIAPCQMELKNYSIGAAGGGCKYAPCAICRSEFWMQEVE